MIYAVVLVHETSVSIADTGLDGGNKTGRLELAFDPSFECGNLAAQNDGIYFHADDLESSPECVEFAQFDMGGSAPVYPQQVKTDYAAKLQLAFGSAATLYGHQTFADTNSSNTVDGNFCKIQLDGTPMTPEIGPVDRLAPNDLSASAIRCENRNEMARAFGESFPGTRWATYFSWTFAE